MAEPILWAERFSYRYPEAAGPALCDVTIEVPPGSFTVVIGESGSGKSTLLRAACGLVPHLHGGEAAGRVSVGGLELRDHGPGDLAPICGALFQDPETQVVMGAVRSEVALALEHRGESPAAVARAVEETALALGIGHLLERRTETLSGGELQRVALAAALVHRPRLLLLDEPTSQLDPVAGDELASLLRRLNEEWGTAVVVAEHRLERWTGAADRVVALRGGRIARHAPPAEFLEWAAREAPNLATPSARLFALAGLGPLPATVKQGRTLLRQAGLVPCRGEDRQEAGEDSRPVRRARGARRRRARHGSAALELRGLWCELPEGPVVLRGVDLRLQAGERVALMGRNGAGKSTLLRHAKGLVEPTRGALRRAGEVALLLQHPGDYLLHEHAGEEVCADALAAAGLHGRESANPRDLSGGERQRLALEVALARPDYERAGVGPLPPGEATPGGEGTERGWSVVCLDEPTRGMDRARKRALADRLERLSRAGAAILVATHDVEFAAEIADRVVLMGEGVVIADGPASEILAGGWHFTTEVARLLDGAGGALTPAHGAKVLERELSG